MKKIVLLLSLFAFVAAAPMAGVSFAGAKEPKKVKCCVKGECKDMTKAECKKAKGKVVKDCKACK